MKTYLTTLFLLISILCFSQIEPEPYKAYYDNGKSKIEGNVINGKQNGIWKIYHENGKLKEEGNWSNGKENGLFKIYHENGKKSKKIIFDMGKRIKQTCWNENGKKIKCE